MDEPKPALRMQNRLIIQSKKDSPAVVCFRKGGIVEFSCESSVFVALRTGEGSRGRGLSCERARFEAVLKFLVAIEAKRWLAFANQS